VIKFWKARPDSQQLRVQEGLIRQQLGEQRRGNRIGRMGLTIAIPTLLVALATLFVALRVDTTPTEVVTVRPFGSGGFLVIEAAATVDGECQRSNVSNRPDAVRCFFELDRTG